jgi:hypothetical protein
LRLCGSKSSQDDFRPGAQSDLVDLGAGISQ